MNLGERLRTLARAAGNPALLALTTVDFAHHDLRAEERARIKEALAAAAVPHWCDRDLLAALLTTSCDEADRLMGRLRALSIVEPFPARGEQTVNVHESARLPLREHLRTTDSARWQALAARARAHVGRDTETHARIEAVYHLLAEDQDGGAAACEALDRELSGGARPEARHALALALGELAVAGWLTGAARVEALLCPLQVRSWRGDIARFEGEVRNVVDLARSSSHPSAVGRALVLLGEVLQAKGRVDEALAAYGEAVEVLTALAATDASHSGWQCELARACVGVGDMYREKKRVDEALAAFREALNILKRIAAAEPANTGWQRDLSVAYSRIGDISLDQKRIDDAATAFRPAIEIMGRLTRLDPLNTDWQREAAAQHGKLAEVFREQGRLAEALTASRDVLAISRRLASTDPGHFDWQRDLANDLMYVANRLVDLGQMDEALAAYREARASYAALVSSDPADAKSQRGLALAWFWIARRLAEQGNEADAQASYREAVSNMERAVAISSGEAAQQELEAMRSWVTNVER